jgi:7-cyano-7-deazaguanine synthase
MSKCVVIFSGGADSTVILHHAIKEFDEVYCLTYNYNQRHKLEIEKAINYTTDLGVGEDQKIRQHTVVDLGFYAKLATASALTNPDIEVPKMSEVIGQAQTLAYVPNRNTVMLSIAAGYAESIGAETILYGAALADDTSGFWDCTGQYLDLFNSVLGLNRKNTIQVQAPLIRKSKKEIIQYGIELGTDFSKTLTCYNGGEVACGRCPSCSARLRGFVDAGYQDSVPYAIDIDWNKYGCKPIISRCAV